MLSIVVPTLNEAGTVQDLLLSLQPWRGASCEVIIVDGGSRDATVTQAAPLADRILHSPPGRARQMNAGADAARGTQLWFLHADSRVPAAAVPAVRAALARIATGDQGLFVRREWFERAGGFPEIALMEDVALSRRLKRLGRPACLRSVLGASSRRWERDGILRTVLLMWSLRLRYALGASPETLARRYRHG
jgi:glycosyltransferase involved in cell wall biosynthesis